LDGAQLGAGMTLLDVGAGEGLVAFRAIDRIGPSLRVILTDVSAPMLRHAESIAARRDVRAQCTFHVCTADDLSAFADASVDVVTTRAVLAYVANKKAAFAEFFRMILAEQFSADERDFFEKMVRPTIESGNHSTTERAVYMQAQKPLA